MILGQSGATAVMHAIKEGVTLQKVDYAKLRERLLADKQVLEHESSGPRPAQRDSTQMKGIVIDDSAAKFEGGWVASVISDGVDGGYHHDDSGKNGAATATFTAKAAEAGKYSVQIASMPNNNRSSKTLVKVNGKEFRINQRPAPEIENVWHAITDIEVAKDAEVSVIISNEGADGFVIADAVRLLPAK